MPKIHKLKSWPEHFAAVKRGDKDFEIRINDRNYEVGDILLLQEFVPLPGAGDLTEHPAGTYTGEETTRRIKHIHDDGGYTGNRVVLGLADAKLQEPIALSPLHQTIIDRLSNGGRIDEVASEVIKTIEEDVVSRRQRVGPPPLAAVTADELAIIEQDAKTNGHPLAGEDRRIERLVPPRAADHPAIYGARHPDTETITISLGGAGIGAGSERSRQAPLPIPPDVYWSEYNQCFYSAITGRHCGEDFYWRWLDRSVEFPKQPREVKGGTMAAQAVEERRFKTTPKHEPFCLAKPSQCDGTCGGEQRKPLTDHERELLVILNEECLEVGKQVSKLLRFGRIAVDRSVRPNVNYDNVALLGMELGHVQHMINVVQACELVTPSSVTAGEKEKGEKLSRYLQTKRDGEVHEGQG